MLSLRLLGFVWHKENWTKKLLRNEIPITSFNILNFFYDTAFITVWHSRKLCLFIIILDTIARPNKDSLWSCQNSINNFPVALTIDDDGKASQRAQFVVDVSAYNSFAKKLLWKLEAFVAHVRSNYSSFQFDIIDRPTAKAEKKFLCNIWAQRVNKIQFERRKKNNLNYSEKYFL